MDLELTEDQVLFHQTTVRFIEAELPVTQVRHLHDDPVGYDRRWLAKAAELGWFAMLVPEEFGGGSVSGAGLLDAAIVAEELGRRVQPGPFLPMNIVAAAIAADGSDEQRRQLLPALAAGEIVASWAVVDDAGNWDAGSGVQITIDEAGATLMGTRGFVQDAQSADWLLVTGDSGGGPTQVVVPTNAPGVTVTPLLSLDLSRRFAHVAFDRVFVPHSAIVGEANCTPALERQLNVALVLTLAETVGVIDSLFTMTVEYSKDRTAFGRPVGSFQALKHVMADAGLFLETCKAGAVAAAKAVQEGHGDATAMVHTVAAYIGDVATDIAQECLQIHGGIGYTWEHDLHLLLRRVQSNRALMGEPTWHRERLCTFYGLGA